MKGDYSLLDMVRHELYKANIRAHLNGDQWNESGFEWKLVVEDTLSVSIVDNKYFISKMDEVVYIAHSVLSCVDEIVWRIS